jgi:hypothetical protein
MSELRDEWVRKAEEDAAVAAWASGAGHYDAARRVIDGGGTSDHPC